MATLKSKLKTFLRMTIKPGKSGLIVGALWLLIGVVWVLRGGSAGFFVLLTMGFLLAIFVEPVVERLVTGKELLSDLEDFRQERVVPLIEELKA